MNLFSSLFTFASLLLGNELGYVISFMVSSPEILRHISLMAACSAVGQLFIFHTIKMFGPLVFATIQTVPRAHEHRPAHKPPLPSHAPTHLLPRPRALRPQVRQFLSVVLSIIIFSHPVNAGECVGILVVFVSLGAQIAYKSKRPKGNKPKAVTG